MLVVLAAVTVRAALYRSSFAAFIAERVEVASPLNAWKRGEAPRRAPRAAGRAEAGGRAGGRLPGRGARSGAGAALRGQGGDGRVSAAVTESPPLRCDRAGAAP